MPRTSERYSPHHVVPLVMRARSPRGTGGELTGCTQLGQRRGRTLAAQPPGDRLDDPSKKRRVTTTEPNRVELHIDAAIAFEILRQRIGAPEIANAGPRAKTVFTAFTGVLHLSDTVGFRDRDDTIGSGTAIVGHEPRIDNARHHSGAPLDAKEGAESIAVLAGELRHDDPVVDIQYVV